jgi:putative nucleotidyltransferase with HDIG domain
MTAPQLEQLVSRARSAIKFPASAWALWKAATDPDLDANALRKVLERDPSLSVQVLKLANSAAYGRAGNVADLGRAIALLGRREIADMALIAANSTGFSELENELLRHVDFWVHSVSCARLARELAPAAGASPDEAFAAGLLHDVGHLLLFNLCSALMSTVLEDALDEGVDLYVIERRRLGYDHAAVGAAVLRSWNMPADLCDAVALHHQAPATIAEALPSIVALANRGASLVEADENPPQEVGAALATQLGCREPEVGARLVAIQTRAESLCTALRR